MNLIELMLSLVLGLMVMLGMVKIYSFLTNTSKLQAAIEYSNYNALAAMQILTNAVQGAGHAGCRTVSKDFVATSNIRDMHFNGFNRISGNDRRLTITKASKNAYVFRTGIKAKSQVLTIANLRVKPGVIVVIADCLHAELAKVSSVIEEHGNWQDIKLTTPLHNSYQQNAAARLLHCNSYYVQKTRRNNLAGCTVPALYVRDISGRNSELVEGVCSLRFKYLVGNSLRTVAASKISDWSAVRGVDITVTSEDEHGHKNKQKWHKIVLLQGTAP